MGLPVEDGSHAAVEDFTQNIVGKAKSLRADIAREKDARVVTEGRHGQRVMTLRELGADVADDRKKRARKREQMFVKVKEEFCDTLKYVQTETQARLDSEEYYNRMMDDSTNKMQAEICKECNERELSKTWPRGTTRELASHVVPWPPIARRQNGLTKTLPHTRATPPRRRRENRHCCAALLPAALSSLRRSSGSRCLRRTATWPSPTPRPPH